MKNLNLRFKENNWYSDKISDHSIQECIIEHADNQYHVCNQLDRATQRAYEIAGVVDSILTILYRKGLITKSDIVDMIPINKEYDSELIIE